MTDPAYADLEALMRAFLQESDAALNSRVQSRQQSAPEINVSAEERERLRSLGYVGED